MICIDFLSPLRRSGRSGLLSVAILTFTLSIAAPCGAQPEQDPITAAHGSSFEERLEAARSRYFAARDGIGSDDGLDPSATGQPSTDAALLRAWLAVENWACAFLEHQPRATGQDLAAWIESLDPPEDCGQVYSECFEHRHLEATAERLEDPARPAWAFTANYPQEGRLAVLAFDSRGRGCTTVWHPGEALPPSDDAPEELRCLAGEPHTCPHRPLGSDVHPLPPTGQGHSRFWVDSWRAGVGGCEYHRQVTVWEWTGRDVEPKFTVGFAASCNATSPPTFDPSTNTLTFMTKQYAKTFYTAGTSPDPEAERRLLVTPAGVKDLGLRWRVPELEFVDNLLDHVARHVPADHLANGSVQKRLERYLGLGPEPEDLRVGFGGGSVLRREGDRTVFCFHGDDMFADGGSSLLFTLVRRGAGIYAESVRTTRESCS